METLEKPISARKQVMLNLGCGQVRPQKWINTDSSFNSLAQSIPPLRFLMTKVLGRTDYGSASAQYMDLSRPWAFKSNSVDVVYASHLFEHLNLSSSKLFLKEATRVLQPGGVIRLVVPDLYQLSKQYIAAYEANDTEASKTFLYWLNLHQQGTYPSTRSRFNKIVSALQSYPHQHKYMYDQHSLWQLLETFSFCDIVTSSYGHSHYIPSISEVECTAEGVASIYLEAKVAQ